MRHQRYQNFAPVQFLIVLIMLGFMALRPSPIGAVLVVPLSKVSQGTLLNIAVRHGGLLLGAGPIGHSLLVYGPRNRLQSAFWQAGAVTLAAPATLCGASTSNFSMTVSA